MEEGSLAGKRTYVLKLEVTIPPTIAIDLMGNLLVCSESM